MEDKLLREVSKFHSKLLRKAQAEFKSDRCIVCNKKTTSFCNSHSVPKFVLKNIANEGKVYNSFCFDDMSIKKDEDGLNNAGTFKLICRECDSKIFQNYENEGNLLLSPNEDILKEIQLKSILQCYAIKGCYKIFFQKVLNKINDDIFVLDHLRTYPKYISAFEIYIYIKDREILLGKLEEVKLRIRQHELDANELRKKITEAKIENDNEFNILFWEILDYKVPLACQSYIGLHGDLEGNLVNDVYDYSENTEIEELYIVVFPLDKKSIVGLFYPKKNHKLDDFAKQFSAKSFSEKLYIINFIIFLYTEDFYLSPNIKLAILENENCKKLKNDLMDIHVIKQEDQEIKNKEDIDLNLRKLKYLKPKIPFALSKNFKL